jgi:hypothetical protein
MRSCGLLLILLAQDTATAPAEFIPIQVLTGNLSAWRAGGDKVEAIDKSGKVKPADRLGTLNGEAARFSTEGSLVVQLRGIKVSPGKGLAVERRGGTLALKLYKGTIVVESYESDIEVETPFGKIGGKEVYFLATVDERGTKVVALEGKVTFTNDMGTVTLGEGMTTEADGGKAPAAPKPSSAADLETARAIEERNLIVNGGFENRLEEWKKDYMAFFDDTKVFHTGRASGRFALNGDISNQPVLPPRTIKGVLKPGSRYLLRFYVRTENYCAAGKPADFKFAFDPSGKNVSKEGKQFLCPASEGAWSVHRFMFEATTPDLWFAMYCGDAKGPYTGQIWFDDFYLGEFPAAPAKPKKDP